MKRVRTNDVKIAGILFFLLQLVFSIIAVAFASSSDVFNTFFIFWMVFILVLFLFISAVFIIARSRSRVCMGTAFAVIMTLVLAVVSFGYLRPGAGGSTQNNTNNKTYSVTYYILIKADDPAQSPDDIKEYKIGVEKSYNFDAAKKALNDLSIYFNCTLNVIAYDNHDSMMKAFLEQKECGAMLIDAASYKTYEASYAAQGDNISNYIRNLGEITV